MKFLAAALAALALVPAAAHAQGAPADPFQWLEDIDSSRSMAWVEGQNVKSAKRLEGDRRYAAFHDEAHAILTAQDRIPTPHFRAGGIDNFWQDATHVHGIWRHAGVASYRTASPQWETLLDLDALSKTEGKNWIWKGAECLKPAQTLCLVRLSNGGSDAVEIREFDTATRKFVDGGFHFTDGKQNVSWIDHDTLIADREWTPGEVTTSGYGYVVKTVTRGGEPSEVFRGQKTDVGVQGRVLRGEGGHADGVLIQRGVTFYEREFRLVTDKGLVLLSLPRKAEYPPTPTARRCSR